MSAGSIPTNATGSFWMIAERQLYRQATVHSFIVSVPFTASEKKKM